jgi:hypothetical protein
MISNCKYCGQPAHGEPGSAVCVDCQTLILMPYPLQGKYGLIEVERQEDCYLPNEILKDPIFGKHELYTKSGAGIDTISIRTARRKEKAA